MLSKEEKRDYVNRTIRVPVAEVVCGGTKQEFYTDLRESLKRCTAAVNFVLTECATIDRQAILDVANGNKVPQSPKIYTYPIVKHQFAGASSVAASICRFAEKAYRSARFEFLTQKRSLPTQRMCPFPLLHNAGTKMLKIKLDEDGNILASFRLLSEKTYCVRLRGGSNYRIPLQTIRSCAANDLIGDSKIWIDGRGVAVIGVACAIKKRENNSASGVLYVKTAMDSFIVACREHDTTPFVVNADHVKRWAAERLRRQDRLRQDRKSGQARRVVTKIQGDVSAKFNNRIKSFIEEVTAHVVSHARRRKVETIEYDSTIRSYLPTFPWYMLKQRMCDKAEELGIKFVDTTSEITPIEFGSVGPHVYCDIGIDKSSGQIRNVKIGRSIRAVGERAKDDARASDQTWVTLFVHKCARAALPKLESRYLALFDQYRINGSREMFAAEPILAWTRAVGCLGNCGNLSQLSQHLEL